MRRQRSWEKEPHAAHGGATPLEAVVKERAEQPRH
jgi:hypothetical protein